MSLTQDVRLSARAGHRSSGTKYSNQWYAGRLRCELYCNRRVSIAAALIYYKYILYITLISKFLGTYKSSRVTSFHHTFLLYTYYFQCVPCEPVVIGVPGRGENFESKFNRNIDEKTGIFASRIFLYIFLYIVATSTINR